MRRTALALTATFSAFTLTVTATPADARDTAGADRADSTSERALPQRPVTIWIKEVESNPRGVVVKVGGKATAWRGKPVQLQKKRDGVFRTVDQGRTNSRGQYGFRKFLPRGTHRLRVKVPKGNGYALTYSEVVGGTVS